MEPKHKYVLAYNKHRELEMFYCLDDMRMSEIERRLSVMSLRARLNGQRDIVGYVLSTDSPVSRELAQSDAFCELVYQRGARLF